MKNCVFRGFSIMLVLVALLSSAIAENNLSEMSISELTLLRDQVSQEINARVAPTSTMIIDCDTYTMEITAIEEGGEKEVDEYYDLYDPGTGTSDDHRRFIFLFTITNKSNQLIDTFFIKNASVNGWMTDGYFGVREIAANKKAKGFANISLLDCEAETINDVQSVEITIEANDDNWNDLDVRTVQFIRNGDGFCLVQ